MTGQKVDNNLLGSYSVRRDVNAAGDALQVVRLDIGTGQTEVPFTGVLIPPAPVSAIQSTHNIGVVSSEILATNPNRKGGYFVAPGSNSASVFVSLNNPATVNDIEIPPGGTFFLGLSFGGLPISNAIYGISASGTQTLISVVG